MTQPMPERSQNESDIRFAEEAVNAMSDKEKAEGGARFGEDVVSVVRDLVTTMADLKSTVQLLVGVIEGKAFGDRTDGMLFRMARIERRQTVTIAIGSFVAARIGYLEWPAILHFFGYGK